MIVTLGLGEHEVAQRDAGGRLIRRKPVCNSIVLAGLVMGLVACGERPPNGNPSVQTATESTPVLSRIETPVRIPLEDLRSFVDDRLTGELHTESRPLATGAVLEIVIARRDAPVLMEMSGTILTTEVPLNLNGQLVLSIGSFRLPPGEGLDADVDLQLRTTVQLEPDWSVRSNSTVELNVSRAELTVAGMTFDPTEILEETLRRDSERIAEALDQYLEDLDLRERMETLWERFRSPVRLRDDPPVWLRVHPVAFGLSPPIGSDAHMEFNIGMEAFIESFVGERPDPVALGEIPPLTELSDNPAHFRIAVPIGVEMGVATQAISSLIVDRETAIASRARVRWLGFDMRGSGGGVEATLGFEAVTGLWIFDNLSGRLAIRGLPRYDPQAQTVMLGKLDYELESDSRLAGILDWLFHDRLRNWVQNELAFPLATTFADIRQPVQDRLETAFRGSYGSVEATVEALNVESIQVNRSNLELLVTADVAMRLDLSLLRATDP